MSTETKSSEDKNRKPIRKRKKLSLRIAMTFVFAAAWLIPIAFFSYFIFHNYRQAYIDKSDNLIQNEVNVSGSLITTSLDAAITKLQKPTYEGEWESLYNRYEKNLITHSDYLKSIRSSLISKYYMDEKIARYAFYMPGDVTPSCYAGKNGYAYESFLYEVQPVAMRVFEKDSNYTEVHIIDNQIYIMRNLYTVKDYQKYGLLVIGLNKDALFHQLPVENPSDLRISVNGKEEYLTMAGAEKNPSGERLNYDYEYKCDNYTLNLHYTFDKSILYEEVNRLNSILDIFLFCMIPLMALSYYFLTIQIESPLRKLTDVAHRIMNGEFGTTVGNDQMPNEEFEGLAESFDAMSVQVKHLVDTVYLEQIATKDAQIQALQAQINPHFLNNTLEMMNWQARMNGDIETCKMIEALGTVLDSSMNRNNHRLVRLSDELHCGDAFLYIMTMRFGQRLQVEKNIQENLYQVQVPSLILQPLLENAIRHGIERVSQGTIWLNIYANVDDMYIDVINTGKHLEPEDLKRIEDIIEGKYRLEKAEPGMHTSIGIYNVNKRIKLIYGTEYGLSVLQTENDKFVSRIRIPRQNERMEEDEKKG